MSHVRRAAVTIVGLLGVSIFASTAFADAAAIYVAPEKDSVQRLAVRLAADRSFGFVPMTVNLSGMIQTTAGDLIPMNGGQQVRFVVESPFLQISNSASTTRLLNDVHYETSSPGPATPMPLRRAVEIRRPGTYSFRVQVIAPDGRVLSSNEVSVRAL